MVQLYWFLQRQVARTYFAIIQETPPSVKNRAGNFILFNGGNKEGRTRPGRQTMWLGGRVRSRLPCWGLCAQAAQEARKNATIVLVEWSSSKMNEEEEEEEEEEKEQKIHQSKDSFVCLKTKQ